MFLCHDGQCYIIVRSLIGDGLPYPGYMSCPAKLCFEEHGLNAGNLSHFKDLNVGDEITPLDV